MVRRILSLVVFTIVISSCCYNGIKSTYGLPRKKITGFNKTSIEYEKIDTLALYKLETNYAYNSISKEYIYIEKDVKSNYPYSSYLKFYKNGKVGLFVIQKSDSLNLERDFFNPKRAKMGYFDIQGKSIRTRISTIGDCSLYVSDKRGEINGDTINLQNKNNHGNIYIKLNVKKDLLENWSPDW